MITIVNIIPKSLSNETHQDSEPNLTINPAHPRQLTATAFTPNPAGGANAPVYVSSDGGTTWALNATVPGGNGNFGTGDITVRFATSSSELYAGDLRGDAYLQLNALRTNAFNAPTTMSVLESRGNIDQPWVQAATVAATGKDTLYVGNNDFNAPNRQTATIDQSLDARAAVPAFTSVRVEKRATAGQDGPQVRMTVHPDGVVYAAFYGWRSFNGGKVTSDVVVVRDDAWGSGANPFTALVDGGDNVAGVRVSTGSTFVFGATLGQQRTGGDISIVVDPTNSKTVYLAFADQQPGGYTLHLRRSVNRGKAWTGDILTIANATNPAVAINSNGKVAFLYQQVTGLSTNPRWETHVQESPNGTSWRDILLATTPAGQPSPQFQPYIGDYVYLTANGVEFFGIFCANNTPDLANFPQGVTYQRNANFTTHTLLAVDNVTPVAPSIDPFFFKIGPATVGAIAVDAKRPYAFVNADDDHLWVDWWSGSAWAWADQGKPPTGTLSGAVGAITVDGGRPYAFVLTNDGHLWVNWWSGSAWAWADQGKPPTGRIARGAGAITVDGKRPYAFVLTNDGHLWVNWWSGTAWAWADQGKPPTGTITASAGAITVDGGRPYAFVLTGNGHLWVNWWSGTAWSWSDQGKPPTGTIAIAAGATTVDGKRPYAFVITNDGHLWVNWWSGSAWAWADQGKPTTGTIVSSVGAITVDGKRPYAFVLTDDGHLWVNWWSGTAWAWSDQGKPATGTIASSVGAITVDGGRPYAFVLTNNGHLWVNWWSGSAWAWADQGKPT